jgi:phage terminase large subunit GpA-like protein
MGIWSTQEQRAWSPQEKLLPSQWVDKHRVIPASVGAEAGKLRLSRTPYIVGIIDAITEPGVEEVVCLKSTQIAWSTLTESLVGYWVDNDPGPILFVLDSEKTAKEVMDERIRPLIDNTPAVANHVSPRADDNTLTATKFDSCSLYMGWSGSPGTLARRAIRYGIFDEVDKYKGNSREADPISLGIERTSTYGYRRRVLIGSTPTTRAGTIWRAWEASGDKRRYYVPCPHCGEFQTLVFAQIKYPKLSITDRTIEADTIEQQSLAHYECLSCRQPIQENAKTKMLARGVWLSSGQRIDRSGQVTGPRPKSKRVGFWINAIYSPWRSFSAIAAEFIRSQQDPGRLQNFRNSWLAEPWEEVIRSSDVADMRRLLGGAPPAKLVPAWAEYIVCTADVQKDRLYWVCRCWGAGYRSQLIAYGVAASFEDLRAQCLSSQWQLASGETSRAHALFIDSKFRRDEVYQFSKTDDRVRPIMGDNDSQIMPVKASPAGNAYGITLYTLNTQLLKDRLAIFQQDKERWSLNDSVEEAYLQHLAAEQKQIVNGKARWEPKSAGTPNHYFDCEVYQLAAAEILRVDLLQAPAPVEHKPLTPTKSSVTPATEIEELRFREANRQKSNSYLGNTSQWLSR